jgi:hypothetical protein
MTSNFFENNKLDEKKLSLILAIFIFANHVKEWCDIFGGTKVWRDILA